MINLLLLAALAVVGKGFEDRGIQAVAPTHPDSYQVGLEIERMRAQGDRPIIDGIEEANSYAITGMLHLMNEIEKTEDFDHKRILFRGVEGIAMRANDIHDCGHGALMSTGFDNVKAHRVIDRMGTMRECARHFNEMKFNRIKVQQHHNKRIR